MKLEILYEDEYIIAAIKPYGVSSQPDRGSGSDMMSEIKSYLFEKQDSDEEPYLAVINRLDRPVGGIILFAKDEETAAKLSDMVQDGEITKYYQAVVKGTFADAEGEMVDYIFHDKKTNLSKIVKKDVKGAKKAILNYEVLDELDTDEGPVTFLLIELITGRHHQIRCQMANHNTPIWGDKKYGIQKKQSKTASGAPRPAKGQKGIGLYSTRMEFRHPMTGEDIFLHREPEGEAFDIVDQMDY